MLDYLFEAVSQMFSGGWWMPLSERVWSLTDALRPYSTVLSLLFLTGIVYCFLRSERIIAETYHHDHAGGGGERGRRSGVGAVPADESVPRKQWRRVEEHLAGEKEGDWRLAILEADVMLDELVSGMGYRGDSLGEKMKGIEKSDFTTLDAAWEAHAVRNRIAHEGAAFSLTEREARRVIGLYEQVFREFRYV